MKNFINKNKLAFTFLALGLLLIVAAAIYLGVSRAAPSVEWQVTLLGRNGQERRLDYREIIRMPSHEAQGGFFTTVGVINGPYTVKGVLLTDICALVGGVAAGDLVSVSAADGYSMVFDFEQLSGGIQTYDPVTIKEVPHEKQVVLLIYEQNGRRLTETDGKPLRLAVVGSEGLLTEGHNWVKWVKKIEVISLEDK